VVFHDLTVEALAARFVAAGMSAEYAHALAAVDDEIARGSERQVTGEVAMLTGRPARTFAAFAAENCACWA
jgi:hypothetical protein